MGHRPLGTGDPCREKGGGSLISPKSPKSPEKPGEGFPSLQGILEWDAQAHCAGSALLLKLAYSCERASGVGSGIVFFLLLPELILTDFFKQGPSCGFILPPEIPDSVRDLQ